MAGFYFPTAPGYVYQKGVHARFSVIRDVTLLAATFIAKLSQADPRGEEAMVRARDLRKSIPPLQC